MMTVRLTTSTSNSDHTPKEDILVVQGDQNAKLGRMCRQTEETFSDPTAMSKLKREVSDF